MTGVWGTGIYNTTDLEGIKNTFACAIFLCHPAWVSSPMALRVNDEIVAFLGIMKLPKLAVLSKVSAFLL